MLDINKDDLVDIVTDLTAKNLESCHDWVRAEAVAEFFIKTYELLSKACK